MEGDNSRTEAELQIERLRKLKEQKDEKEKKMKDEAMPFIQRAPKPAAVHAPARRKIPGMIKVDKTTFEKVHRIVKRISAESGNRKLSKERFVNIVLKEALKNEALFSGVKNAQDLKALLGQIIKNER